MAAQFGKQGLNSITKTRMTNLSFDKNTGEAIRMKPLVTHHKWILIFAVQLDRWKALDQTGHAVAIVKELEPLIDISGFKALNEKAVAKARQHRFSPYLEWFKIPQLTSLKKGAPWYSRRIFFISAYMLFKGWQLKRFEKRYVAYLDSVNHDVNLRITAQSVTRLINLWPRVEDTLYLLTSEEKEGFWKDLNAANSHGIILV